VKWGRVAAEEERILFTTKAAKFTKVRVKISESFVSFVIFVVSF
jgi:hypothetical protein